MTGAGSSRQSPQLVLPVQLPQGHDWACYVPGPNQAAASALRSIPETPMPGGIYLWGSAGSGKSHLLQATVRAALDQGRQAVYVPLDHSDLRPAALTGLDSVYLVALDGLEGVAGAAWEEALFHLYNRAQAAGTVLIFAARAAPAGLGLELPDLVSRLQAATAFRLKPLDDGDLEQLLIVHAEVRGLALPQAVARYLVQRLPRDGHTLMAALARLDRAALAAKRPLTVPFVRDALGLPRC